MDDDSQLPNVVPQDLPGQPDTRVPISSEISTLATPTSSSSITSPSSSSSSSSSSKPNPKFFHKLQPLDPRGQMFHCMLSYRVDTDQGMVVKLHNKLHTLFAVEGQPSKSLQRTRSGSAVPAFSPSPALKRGWSIAANAVFDGSLAIKVDGGSEVFPFQGETLFPREFDQCDEAKTSDFHVFLDKVCLKSGENWQGTGELHGGGFIGAIFQSLLFVPILSVKQKKSSEGFEELSSAPDDNSFEVLDGSLGRLLRLNTKKETNPSLCDNVLLELIIAKVLHDIGGRSPASSGKTYPCIKILPLLVGNKYIFDCVKMLSSNPHHATNNKAIDVLKKAGLGDEDLEKKVKSESVQSVVGWYFVKQSIKLWTFGEEDNQVKHAAIETIRHARESLVKTQQLSQKTEMSEVAKLKPLASELFDFLSANLIGDYGPVLAHHDIHSIRQFSMLDAQTCRELANDASIRNKTSRSAISEFGRLWPVVELAKKAPEAQSLSDRLAKFIDKDAHWAAALYSTQAVDILMRKPIFAFLQISCVIILIFVGFLLTLSPIKMERVFPSTNQGNSTVTEKVERYNTSSVLCWVAAFFMILSFSFAWLRSPRSGRVVLALGLLAVFLTQGVVYVFWDPYNVNLCRFKSLQPTPESASKCVQAYAISFAITEIVALAIFSVLLLRQELFWDVSIFGIIAFIAPNFLIAQTVDYSSTQYLLSIILIVAFALLLCFTHWKVLSIRQEANAKAKDSEYLEAIWAKVDKGSKVAFKAKIDEIGSKQLNNRVEHWHGGWGRRKVIEVRSGITDIDLLFSMAEIVNTPIQNYVDEWVKAVFGTNSSVSVKKGPVKRPSRAIAKVYRVYRGDVSKLTDVVRCQILFPDLSKIQEFLDHLLKLHNESSIDILRVRNRLDDDYKALELTGGYRDCNLKIRLAFELHKTDGSVLFTNVSRPKESVEDQAKKCCFGVVGSTATATDSDEPGNPGELHFICELQIILQECAAALEEDSKAYKRYVKRRDALAN